MQYLKSFDFATEENEVDYVLSFAPKIEMQCYSNTNFYPFKVLPQKQLSHIDLEPVTILYGSNGSGKSTCLNVIAEKLQLARSAPFNKTPFLEDYLGFCDYELCFGSRVPANSRIICSDDVFDFLIDVRSLNQGIDRRRDALFEEYRKSRKEEYLLRSLDDLEEFKRRNETKRRTMSDYVTRRLPKEVDSRSNGESAFFYFTRQIGENALYLLDEPENSLSAKLQKELARFIEDSVRFYNCQFVISTHSPFLLSVKGAKIYDLDTYPVVAKRWTELENMRLYHAFFEEHREQFLKAEQERDFDTPSVTKGSASAYDK